MSDEDSIAAPTAHPSSAGLARVTLCAFLLTFLAARTLVFLIMTRRAPDLYLHLGGTHVHHLNYGIFLLALTAAYLLFAHPAGKRRSAAAVAYGAGLALTFDEFGMWLHLGGPYWQRASFDAVTVIAAVLGLIGFAPGIRRLRTRHWLTVGALVVAMGVFTYFLMDTLSRFAHRIGPTLRQVEQGGPQ